MLETATETPQQAESVQDKPRTLDDVQKEYVQACTMAGDKFYRIGILAKDLIQLWHKATGIDAEAQRIIRNNATEKAKNAEVTEAVQ